MKSGLLVGGNFYNMQTTKDFLIAQYFNGNSIAFHNKINMQRISLLTMATSIDVI